MSLLVHKRTAAIFAILLPFSGIGEEPPGLTLEWVTPQSEIKQGAVTLKLRIRATRKVELAAWIPKGRSNVQVEAFRLGFPRSGKSIKELPPLAFMLTKTKRFRAGETFVLEGRFAFNMKPGIYDLKASLDSNHAIVAKTLRITVKPGILVSESKALER